MGRISSYELAEQMAYSIIQNEDVQPEAEADPMADAKEVVKQKLAKIRGD